MELVIQLIVMGVLGAVCAAIAGGRGRSAIGWFFIGFFLGCIGLILVLVLPDLNAQSEREQRLARENRRLRERVKKDRVVADQRHAQVQNRLGVHDVALGVDTNQGELAAPSPPPPLPAPVANDLSSVSWHTEQNGEPSDALTFVDLRMMWKRGAIDESTRVWADGMGDWARIADVRELRSALDA